MIDKKYAKYLIYNNHNTDAELKPEDFLKYTNELWSFSLSLNSLGKINSASNKLDLAGLNVNYLFASLWLGQKNCVFTEDFATQHEQLTTWHTEKTLNIRNMRLDLEQKLKQAHFLSSSSIFGQIRDNILQSEYLMEQHEQALLYSYFMHKKGIEQLQKENNYANRLECIKQNFKLVLANKNIVDSDSLSSFLAVILDMEDAIELTKELTKI